MVRLRTENKKHRGSSQIMVRVCEIEEYSAGRQNHPNEEQLQGHDQI